MDEFEQYLQANLPKAPSFHPHYEKALAQMLLAGGKRFRPALLLAVVEAINPLLKNAAMQVALAIEMLHTYSLIHDDLPTMDNADLRRSTQTLHKTYDETTAILVGDALNTHAFYLLATVALSSDAKVELIKTLSYDGGIGGMVLGQALDCHFEKTPLDLKKIEFIHTHKTAKLIAASLKMGAIVAGLETDLIDRLYSFGLDLGLFFQIRDDIIDATQDEATAGKTTQNDVDKNSFVTILGLDAAQERAAALSQKLREKLQTFPQHLSAQLTIIVDPYLLDK